jgi:hypothetical protein
MVFTESPPSAPDAMSTHALLVRLDVVVIVPTFLRRIACWLGRVTGQRFLYDLCHAETVVLPHRGPKR